MLGKGTEGYGGNDMSEVELGWHPRYGVVAKLPAGAEKVEIRIADANHDPVTLPWWTRVLWTLERWKDHWVDMYYYWHYGDSHNWPQSRWWDKSDLENDNDSEVKR